MNKICLDGLWLLTWNDLNTVTLSDIKKLYASGKMIPCHVPGAVHTALVDAEIIEDPIMGMNATKCSWIKEKEWWYLKEFFIQNREIKNQSILCFEGLDLYADIWLNNQYLGSHKNAFIPVQFDVTNNLNIGSNIVIVKLREGLNQVKEKPIDFMEISWNSDEPYRTWLRKPQFCYKWDFTVSLPTCGIWRGVYIKNYEQAFIKETHINSEFSYDNEFKVNRVELSTHIYIENPDKRKLYLKCEWFADKRYEKHEVKIYQIVKKICNEEELISCSIAEPNLWWPIGMGRQYLYKLKIYLANEEGKIIDSKFIHHGIRRVQIQEFELGEGQKTFTFEVNNKPVFIKGANWVPTDFIIGKENDETKKKLLDMTADLNMNMLRVWGGGVYESDFFYDYCDQLGIMVIQDFMFACAYYPDFDEEFVDNVKNEATAIIMRLRSHSSLVAWIGNNEVQEMHYSIKEWHKDYHELYGSLIFNKLLPELCKQYDPNRIYRESSPFGGNNPMDLNEGDQHFWHFTHRPNSEYYLDIWKYPELNFKFLSEFGVLGALDENSLKKCLTKEGLSSYDSEEWLYHTNTCNLFTTFIDKFFGNKEELPLIDFVRKSQVIQAETLRHIYDSLRVRKFTCSGLLVWSLNDCYSTNSYAIIDYYLSPKAAYYYLRRSLTSLSIVFKGYEPHTLEAQKNYETYYHEQCDPVDLYVVNDLLVEKQVLLYYRVATLEGRLVIADCISKISPQNGVTKIISIELREILKQYNPNELVIIGELFNENVKLNENRYFLVPFKDLALKPANIDCLKKVCGDDTVELRIISKEFVWMLHINTSDDFLVDDNDFDLFPNTERIINVKTKNIDNKTCKFTSFNPSLIINFYE